MKKTLAKLLVLSMLLTSVVMPAGKENSCRAAAKKPTLNISGAIEKLKLLMEDGMAQEVGKTITVTCKNVKKGNVKGITCFVVDPRVATVTKKYIAKKKNGFKVKIKKLGVTHLSVCVTLKKKQAGSKVWNYNLDITGVRELTQKETAACEDEVLNANMNSVMLDKYGSFMLYLKRYDEKGNTVCVAENFQTKEDMYSCEEYPEDNELFSTYLTSNTGYEISNVNGKQSGYYIFEPEEYRSRGVPVPDDPEERREMKETTDIEYGYTDGNYYYFSEVNNSKAEKWERTESIINAKTYAYVLADYYAKNEKGKLYKYASQSLEPGADEPDIYRTMKFLYTAEGKEKRKLEFVIDPGTSEEQRISAEMPRGELLKLFGIEGYGIYSDAEGKTVFSEISQESDELTVYYIKTTAEK